MSDNFDKESDSTVDNIIKEMYDFENAAKVNLTIPEKSKELYEKQFQIFESWRKKMSFDRVDESIVLNYFKRLSKKFVPSTLWSLFSRLKPMIHVHYKIDIGTYWSLVTFLKDKSKDYDTKKSKTFTNEEIERFLKEAPDDNYLAHKVVMIMGLYGGLRSGEIKNMKIQDVQQHGYLFHVVVPVTKTGKPKSFVTNECVFPIVDKYIKLRPKSMEQFFLAYRHKRCIRQNMGVHKIQCIVQDIAKFLDIPDPELYTGHCFRRSSAKLRADAKPNILTEYATAEQWTESGVTCANSCANEDNGRENKVDTSLFLQDTSITIKDEEQSEEEEEEEEEVEEEQDGFDSDSLVSNDQESAYLANSSNEPGPSNSTEEMEFLITDSNVDIITSESGTSVDVSCKKRKMSYGDNNDDDVKTKNKKGKVIIDQGEILEMENIVQEQLRDESLGPVINSKAARNIYIFKNCNVKIVQN